MKRISVIFQMLLVIFVAGCSKDVETDIKPAADAWIYDETLPVPIQFGANSFNVDVKSAFNDMTDLVDQRLGVIALDVQKEWVEAGAKNDEVICLDDEIVTCGYDESYARYMLKFDQPRYYPYQSYCNFSFFAYHKGDNNNSPVYEQERVRLPISEGVWGNQDLIYARADADTLFVKYSDEINPVTDEPYGYVPAIKGEDATAFYNGFNASYIRYIAKDKPSNGLNHSYTTHLPALNFTHPATNIRFMAVFDKGTSPVDVVPTIKRVSIKGDEIYSGADLVIVHKDAGQEGQFDVSGYEKGTVALRNEQGTAAFDITPTYDGVELGDGFFFQPISADSPLTLLLTIDNGQKEEEIEVEIGKHPEFKAGHFYIYELRMHRSVGVKITVASVAPWLDGWADAGVTPDSIGQEEGPSADL